jgi:hypothetical protein
MIIRTVLCFFDKKKGVRPSASEWCRCVAARMVVPAAILFSLSGVCGSDSSLVCFQKRQGKTEKLTSHRPSPSQRSPAKISRQSKKKNTIHGCWREICRSAKCGGLTRRVVFCRLLDVEFGEKPISSWCATSFPLVSCYLAAHSMSDDANQSDVIQNTKTPGFREIPTSPVSPENRKPRTETPEGQRAARVFFAHTHIVYRH